MMNTKKTGSRGPLRTHLPFLALALLAYLSSHAFAGNPIKPFAVNYTSDSYYHRPGVVETFARFELAAVNRFVHDAYNGADHSLWDRLKQLNPKMELFVYVLADQTKSNQDSSASETINSIARYDKNVGFGDRGHSMGDLWNDNNELILRTRSGDPLINTRYRETLLDFGNPVYSDYWIEAVEADILDRPWAADGIHADNVLVDSGLRDFAPGYPNLGVYPARYPDARSWNAAKNARLARLQSDLRQRGQKLFANRGNTFTPVGHAAWEAADNKETGDFLAFEEGFVAVRWGSAGVQFFDAAQWKSSVETIAHLQYTRAALYSHTNLRDGESGTSNFGQPVNSWDVLYYGLGSYLLASGESTDTFFYFRATPREYESVSWYDEYEQLDKLGEPTGAYTSFNREGLTIYMRSFENGFVYVNPNEGGANLSKNKIMSIVLPEPAKRITHEVVNDDWSQLPNTRQFDLEANRAAIFVIPRP